MPANQHTFTFAYAVTPCDKAFVDELVLILFVHNEKQNELCAALSVETPCEGAGDRGEQTIGGISGGRCTVSTSIESC